MNDLIEHNYDVSPYFSGSLSESIERKREEIGRFLREHSGMGLVLDQVSLSLLRSWERFEHVRSMTIIIRPSETFRSLCFLRSFPSLESLELVASNRTDETVASVKPEISLEGIENCQRLVTLSLVEIQGLRDIDTLNHCTSIVRYSVKLGKNQHRAETAEEFIRILRSPDYAPSLWRPRKTLLQRAHF